MRTAAAAAALGALVVAPAASARTEAPPQLSFVWPADGTLSSPFGVRWGRMHFGIDIGVLRSLDVHAAAPGRVVAVGWIHGFEGYGNIVEVDVGYGFTTIYAHLARSSVHRGDVVHTGERLGIAGCTGWCTGTHLHFELRQRGRAVDPLILFG